MARRRRLESTETGSTEEGIGFALQQPQLQTISQPIVKAVPQPGQPGQINQLIGPTHEDRFFLDDEGNLVGPTLDLSGGKPPGPELPLSGPPPPSDGGGGGGGGGGGLDLSTGGPSPGSSALGLDPFANVPPDLFQQITGDEQGFDAKRISDILFSIIEEGGGFNEDIVNRRTEIAREGLERQRKSRDASNRGRLAARGILGEGTVSGPELTSVERLESDIADRFQNAFSGIFADESRASDNRLTQALQQTGQLTSQESRLALDSFRAFQNAQLGLGGLDLGQQQIDLNELLGMQGLRLQETLGLGNLALGNLGQENAFNLGLARFGLDRDIALNNLSDQQIDISRKATHLKKDLIMATRRKLSNLSSPEGEIGLAGGRVSISPRERLRPPPEPAPAPEPELAIPDAAPTPTPAPTQAAPPQPSVPTPAEASTETLAAPPAAPETFEPLQGPSSSELTTPSILMSIC